MFVKSKKKKMRTNNIVSDACILSHHGSLNEYSIIFIPYQLSFSPAYYNIKLVSTKEAWQVDLACVEWQMRNWLVK